MQLSFDNELQHYGVLGMKWGIRKSDKESGNSQTKKKTTTSKVKTNKKEKKTLTDVAWDIHRKKNELWRKSYATAQKGVKAAYKVKLASFADDVFLRGAGKKTCKKVLSSIGKMATSTIKNSSKVKQGEYFYENVIKDLKYDPKTNSWK